VITEKELDWLARQAYRAYGQVTGFKNYQGHSMPDFDGLGETIQSAWRAAARQVTEAALILADRGPSIMDEPADPT
jgi:hypothetical protein